MPAVYEQYTQELQDKFGYLATWLPSTTLKLGDVGVLRRDRFEFVTTLNDLGLDVEIRDLGGAADYQYVSAEGADIGFSSDVQGGEVQAPSSPSGSAHLSVRFSKANAIVFIAAGCRTTFINRQDELGREIVERKRTGSWADNHVVITELVTADSATILISATEAAHVDLSAKAQLAPAGLSLANASAGLQVTGSSGIATQILAARSLTPLFRASGIRSRLFGQPRFEVRSAEATMSFDEPDLRFTNIEYDDID